MAILSWGRPKIWVAELDDAKQPKNWKQILEPEEDTTKLDTQEGEETTAYEEGHVPVDSMRLANTYTFEFVEFTRKGEESTFSDKDGVVSGLWAIKLQPLDPTCKGIDIAMASIAVKDTYSVKEGIKKIITCKPLAKDNDTPQVDYVVIEDPTVGA